MIQTQVLDRARGRLQLCASRGRRAFATDIASWAPLRRWAREKAGNAAKTIPEWTGGITSPSRATSPAGSIPIVQG
jgi:hypothetical protein